MMMMIFKSKTYLTGSCGLHLLHHGHNLTFSNRMIQLCHLFLFKFLLVVAPVTSTVNIRFEGHL